MQVETKDTADTQALVKTEQAAAQVRKSNSQSFRYYIHDSIETFRIELIGELTSAALDELAGCHRTASATIRGRRVVLDVRRLKSVDDAGRAWLTTMIVGGAVYATALHRKKGWQLSDKWMPSDARPAAPAKPKRGVLLRLRSRFASSSSKDETEVEVPWADCRG